MPCGPAPSSAAASLTPSAALITTFFAGVAKPHRAVGSGAFTALDCCSGGVGVGLPHAASIAAAREAIRKAATGTLSGRGRNALVVDTSPAAYPMIGR